MYLFSLAPLNHLHVEFDLERVIASLQEGQYASYNNWSYAQAVTYATN
jgi:hypothetical protein